MSDGAPTYDVLLWKNKVWESRVSNSGDLAIIRNTFLKLRRQLPGARLHMLTDDPAHAAREYGVEGHPVALLRRPWRLAALLRRMDLVILGGGTVFQDNYFVGVIPINLSLPLLAKALGARIACTAIGVGSAEEVSWLGRQLCRLAVPRFDSISVRDEESKRILEDWMSIRPTIHLTTDIAVDLPAADFGTIEPALLAEGLDLSAGETVAIAARKVFHHDKSWLYFLPSSVRHRFRLQTRARERRLDAFKTTLARVCDHVIERHGAKILLVPFYSSGGTLDSQDRRTPTRLFSSSDDAFAEEVAGRMGRRDKVHILRRSYTPPEMLAIISRCKALVGVPYHSVVFASSQNVPVMGVKYVSKVERYMRSLELEDFAVEAGAPFETFRATFDRLWSEREPISRRLSRKNAELRALSDETIRIIRDLLRAEERQIA